MYHMGRYKHPNDQKTATFSIRMTIDERDRLDKLASKEGLTISDLVRKWIRETPLRARKGKVDEAVSIG